MLGLLVPLALVAGLVKLAWREREEPVLHEAVARARLAKILGTPRGKLKLDQAEDGVVLSRRLGRPRLEREFRREVARMKKTRRTHALQERKRS